MAKDKTTRSDGRIRGAVYLGDGKYRYVYAHNQKELKKKIDEMKFQVGKGLDVSSQGNTFGKWADLWLNLKKQSKLSAGRKDICGYRRECLSALDNIPISKIKSVDIQYILLEKAAEGVSEYVQTEIKNTARQIFDMAIENRVIDFNPAAFVKVLEPETAQKHERRALTPKEQGWIEAPSKHRGQLAAMIMLHSGLRRGELIALRWHDIDLEKGTISVNKAVSFDRGRPSEKKTTKTTAGIRTVYIPQKLIDYLREKDPGDPDALVVPSAKGDIMTSSGWRRMWESYMAELNLRFGDFEGIIDPNTGEPYEKPRSKFCPKKIPMVIPPITAHWLRHTFITNLYFAGVDVLTAMQQAGHADVQTTMNIYTHLDRTFKEKQMDKLNDYLSNRK